MGFKCSILKGFDLGWTTSFIARVWRLCDVIFCGIVAGAIALWFVPVLVSWSTGGREIMVGLGYLVLGGSMGMIFFAWAVGMWLRGSIGVLRIDNFIKYAPTWLGVIVGIVVCRLVMDYQGDADWALRDLWWIAGGWLFCVLLWLINEFWKWAIYCLKEKRKKKADSKVQDTEGILRIPEKDRELFDWLLDDEPIEKDEQDRFEFQPVARMVAERLVEVDKRGYTPSQSLIGPWGAGKSSVIGLVRHELEHMDGGDRIRLIQVSAWGFGSYEAVLRHIVDEIVRDLRKDVDCLAMAGVSDSVVESLGKIDGRLGALLHLISIREGVDGALGRIASVLRVMGERLVLCVEDVDRIKGGDRYTNDLDAFFDKLVKHREIALILTGGHPGEHQPDFARLCGYDALVPRLDVKYVGNVIGTVWQAALRQDYINPTIRSERSAFEKNNLTFMEHRTIGAAITTVLRTPRNLKKTLREAWKAWEKLVVPA